MVDVIQFPPVSWRASEHTQPGVTSTSYGMRGRPYGSQFGPVRRVVRLDVNGVARHGTGRVEVLKDMLRKDIPLVRLKTPPRYWIGAARKLAVGGQVLTWTDDGDPLAWTDNGDALTWRFGFNATGTPGSADGVHWIDVTGLPASQLVSIPGVDIVSGGLRALATREVYSAADGTARIYTSKYLAVGSVEIGSPEYAVFHIPEMPRAMQTTGGYTYQFEMVEQYESQFADGFTVIDPW